MMSTHDTSTDWNKLELYAMLQEVQEYLMSNPQLIRQQRDMYPSGLLCDPPETEESPTGDIVITTQEDSDVVEDVE